MILNAAQALAVAGEPGVLLIGALAGRRVRFAADQARARAFWRLSGRSARDHCMWLNQQTFDAIQILATLAEAHPRLLRAADVASATGITPMNVQKTVHALGDTGLITAVRGRNGGVRLGRAPETITLAAIVRVFEPKDCPVGFLPWSTADQRISDVLFRAHRGFFQPLEQFTLAALLASVGRPQAPASA